MIIIPLDNMPTLNQHDNANRVNRYAGASLKKKATRTCAKHIKEAMDGGLEVKQDDMPLKLKFTWYWKNRQTDKDNISFIKKYVFDGMIKADLIENDGWKEVGSWIEIFEVDKGQPRVEIEILRSELGE